MSPMFSYGLEDTGGSRDTNDSQTRSLGHTQSQWSVTAEKERLISGVLAVRNDQQFNQEFNTNHQTLHRNVQHLNPGRARNLPSTDKSGSPRCLTGKSIMKVSNFSIFIVILAK